MARKVCAPAVCSANACDLSTCTELSFKFATEAGTYSAAPAGNVVCSCSSTAAAFSDRLPMARPSARCSSQKPSKPAAAAISTNTSNSPHKAARGISGRRRLSQEAAARAAA